jgi:Protein of unknown function (DUF2510)
MSRSDSSCARCCDAMRWDRLDTRAVPYAADDPLRGMGKCQSGGTSMTSDQNAPAGWYPDSTAEAPAGQLRYWDGSGWTPHTSAPRTAPTVAEPAGKPGTFTRWATPAVVGVLALLLGIGIGAGAGAASGESDAAAPAAAEPAPTVTVTATVPGAVPQDRLDALTARESALDQREADLDAREAELDALEAELAEQEQAIEPAPPASAPEPADGCHQSYDPCVPIASDADCEGGSGNGPVYVSGPVRVIGPDEYGLDSNGDGVGCE